MSFQGLISTAHQLLEKALDGVALHQRVTAHNIANVDTPGFKRYRLSFEDTLRKAVHRSGTSAPKTGMVTHPKHFPIGQPQNLLSQSFTPTRVSDTVMRNDGNNVDIEMETAQVIKDQIHYSALAQEVTKRYAMLKDAITGRG